MNTSMSYKKKYDDMVFRFKTYLPGQLFGEEDALQDRKYTTTVVCLSGKGALFCIKKTEFLNKFFKDDKSYDEIKRGILVKDQKTRKEIIRFIKARKNEIKPKMDVKNSGKQNSFSNTRPQSPLKSLEILEHWRNSPPKSLSPDVKARLRNDDISRSIGEILATQTGMQNKASIQILSTKDLLSEDDNRSLSFTARQRQLNGEKSATS